MMVLVRVLCIVLYSAFLKRSENYLSFNCVVGESGRVGHQAQNLFIFLTGELLPSAYTLGH